MKKYYAIIAVFLATRLLAGCAQPAPAPEENTPAAATDAMPVEDALRPLGTGLDAGNAQGRLATLPSSADTGWNSVLYWVDYASEQCVPLCTDPGCAHDSEACTAWLPAGSVAFSLPDGGVLKEQFDGGDGSGTGAITLTRCGADGGDPHTLAEMAVSTVDLLAADTESIWFDRLGVGSEQMEICRLPLDGGEPQVLYSYDLDDAPWFLGCDARRLVYMRTDLSIYERMADAGEEELESLRQEAASAEFTREVFFVDADTGEETPFLQWDAHQVQALWRDGTLWRSTVENGEGVLRWDAVDGTSGEARYAWPGRALTADVAVPIVEGTVDVQVLLQTRFMDAASLNDPAVESGQEAPTSEWERIALDPATGTVTPLTLSYVALGSGSHPVTLLGRSGSDLFVRFEQQVPFDPAAFPQGDPDYYTQDRCGLLSCADFLANTPNYREIVVPRNIEMW